VIRTAHGLRGEVRVDPSTDVPDRFRAGATLECEGVGPLWIESVRPGTRATIVRFRGYADRVAAETLRGRALSVTRSEARRAAGRAHLWADLIGLRAVDPDGTELGTLSEVIRAGETDVLVISSAGPELLVPALESVVREVDVAGGRIVVVPQEEA
jgi:16S rRNA processing protein RimM